MTSRDPKCRPDQIVQIAGVPWDGIPGHQNLVLQLGPRYKRPLDDTTDMSISHRTNGGGISVLLERRGFAAMAQALAAPEGAWTHDDAQCSARVSWSAEGPALIEIWWNGSRQGRRIFLLEDQFSAFQRTVTEMDAHGWAGWKSGETT